MCDQCTGKVPEDAGKQGQSALSRRAVLAMGGSLAAGVALGLWNCQNPEKNGFLGAQKGTFTTKPSVSSGSAPNSGGSSSVSQPVPAESSASATVSSQSQPATATQAVSRPATPDLGAEVFPDAAGRAIARAGDAPVIIVPRTDWTTARPDLTHIEVMNGISRLTVHHTAGTIQTDAWTPTAADVEGIREFHSASAPAGRQWADIAYHFAIDRAGRVWQGRPLAYQGAHARGHNAHNLGIVLLGNFAVQSPSAAQLTSLALFIGFVRKLYAVPLGQVFTHGELVETECPGKLLQDYMDRGRTAWGEAEGTAWRKVATYPASDPGSG